MDKVQHKLFQFEAQPPSEVWHRIEASLAEDEGIEYSFPKKLEAYETAPPRDAWNKIEAGLGKNEATVLPFTKRYYKTFKYGAAAVVLAVAAFLLLNKNPKVDQITSTSNIHRQDTPTATPKTSENADSDLASVNNLYNTNKQTTYVPVRKGRSIPLTSRVTLPTQAASSSAHRSDHIIIPKNIPVVKSDMPERYIVFSKTSGEAVRLSKKLFDLFACADDSENCRENIEYAQQQMASPQKMASADFGGVLDVLKTMNYQ